MITGKNGVSSYKMVEAKHLRKVQEIGKRAFSSLIQERIKNLEYDYQENEFIEKADVSQEGEDISVKLQLNFETVDAEKQNIPLVFEYGGVIFKEEDGKKQMVMIPPGMYISRNIMGNE